MLHLGVFRDQRALAINETWQNTGARQPRTGTDRRFPDVVQKRPGPLRCGLPQAGSQPDPGTWAGLYLYTSYARQVHAGSTILHGCVCAVRMRVWKED